MARSDVPPQLIREVRELLSNLHNTEAGQKILKAMYLSKFELADNKTYRPVQEFIEHFTKTVRPLNP